MKIGIIRKQYVLHGGAERYIGRLIKELIGRGHEVHIFANKWDIPSPLPPGLPHISAGVLNGAPYSSHQHPTRGEDLCGERITFHKVPIIDGFSFLKVLSFALFAKMKLGRVRLDVIHSFEKTFRQDVYRAGDGCHAEFLRQRDKNLSFLKRWLVRLNPLHITILFIEKRLFKEGNYRKIIANSNRVKDDIIRHYKVPSEDIVVIYNGVNSQEFNPEGKGRIDIPNGVTRVELLRDTEVTLQRGTTFGKDSLVLLFAGSGFERKGLGFLIEAVGEINKQRKTVLLVVGNGKYATYKKLSRRFGVEEKVYFLGPKSDIKRFYLASDIFVLPSIYEPFSNACLEAMACGLPVITSRVNGISELLEKDDEVRDLIIDEPRNSNEIARKVVILFDEEKRRRIGKRCRDIACGLTIDENVNKTLEVYKEVIECKNQRYKKT